MQKKYKIIMNYSQISATILLFAVGAGGSHAVDTSQTAQQKSPSTNKQDKGISQPAVKATMPASLKIYRDPETGEFITPPDDDNNFIQQQNLQREPGINNFSDEGLEMVTHPDGSVSVDLQGRFQSEIYATMDKNGKIKVDHRSSGANSKATSPDPQTIKP